MRLAPDGWSRRRLLATGAGSVVAAGAAVVELVDHGVLPGKGVLDQIDGACSAATPNESFAPPGPSASGQFYSRARNRTVGYSIAYPPGHRVGDQLPLAVYMHAFGGDHRSGLGGISLERALAGRGLKPFAIVSADGGGLYWNPHPGDDPLAMVVDELLPICRRNGLGRGPAGIGALGISMGGYGALLLAETHPRLVAAVAAISPAVWTSYPQARSVNAGAYASAADFAADDLITHSEALAGIPVRIVSGSDDPFHGGVAALAERLPRSAAVLYPPGCHDGAFFASQQRASLEFLGEHLTS